MTWTNITLKDVNPNLEIIPEGKYTFRLAPGSHVDDNGRLIVSAHIVNDGEFTGRKVTFSYPSPEKAEWSDRMVKRLQEALGVDAVDGENPVEFLNRAAGNNFGAPIVHREYTPEGSDQSRKRAEVGIFNVFASV